MNLGLEAAKEAGKRNALEDYAARTGKKAHAGEAKSLLAVLPAPTCPAGMALIPAGKFTMGDDRSRQTDEKPAYEV